MKRALFALLLIAAAAAAGLACSELVYRAPGARAITARILGRGELVAIAGGQGFYDSDLGEDADIEQLIIVSNLRKETGQEQIDTAAVKRHFDLLQYQFGTAKIFAAELESSGLSPARLRDTIAEHLRAQKWLEKQAAPQPAVTEQESRAFYQRNLAWFAQPARFRVSHLFLAAPEATPPEIVQEKQDAAKALAKRLAKGEDFAQLIAEMSEDEASKGRGGDLGFFSAARMPADFIAEVEKLASGKPSAPVRLPLGFHILQLVDRRPARQMPFEEVQTEIDLHLTNAKRVAAIERVREGLKVAEFVRPRL